MSKDKYKPDYLVSPGEVVKDYLIDKYHYDQSSSMALELASMELDIAENELKEIVWCNGMITPTIAEKLTKLGRPAHFWINLERQYQEDRARLSGIGPWQNKQVVRSKMETTNTEEHHRPWGYYENLASGPGYLVKRIVVSPGKRTSLQWHEDRYEIMHVVSGDKWDLPYQFKDTEDIFHLALFHVPQKAIHRISNTGTEPLVIIEVQTSDKADGCREDDIHRIEDDFGRCEEVEG